MDFVFNIALGRVVERTLGSADLRLLLLKVSDEVQTHRECGTIASLLATVAEEADFTNYERKTLTNVTVNVLNELNQVQVHADNIIYTAAGGTVDNTITDAIVYEHVTDDTDSVPLVQLAAGFTTDGSDANLAMGEEGWFKAR